MYVILRSTHKPLVQSLLIIRLKTSTSENGNCWSFTCTRRYFAYNYNPSIWYTIVEAEEVLAMNTPCCHQGAHCECFRYWAASSVVDGTVSCGYCRTLFPDNELCFLCLEKKNNELNSL